MSLVNELIREETDGAISFGNHTLGEKTKLEDFNIKGNLYKVKTFNELTKLEKDGMFLYESEPGTSVNNMVIVDGNMSFNVCGDKDAMITVGLLEDTEYNVSVGGKQIGGIKTNLSGKLSISVELEGKGEVAVRISK